MTESNNKKPMRGKLNIVTYSKSYVNFENLSLTQGLKVGNNSYGSLVGADFPVIKLKHGWRL